jgi:hypothetical protein
VPKIRYLGDYCREFGRALWHGLGITDTSVIVVIVALFIVRQFMSIHHELHPPAWLVTALAGVFITYKFLETAFRLYAAERERREQLEEERKPQLIPEQPNLAPTFKFVSKDKPRFPVTYVRVPIRNASAATAAHCSAKLLKIEHLSARDGSNSGWRALAYSDTLDLAWANKPADDSREIDLAPGNVDTLDVAYVFDGSRELRIASIIPANYPSLMGLAGDYRFTVQLASSNAGSRTIRLRVHWDFKTLTFPGDPVEIV